MPELPEVTIIVRGLDKKLKGLIFKSVDYDWPKGFVWGDYSEKDLKGAKVVGVRRLGKVVIIDCVKSFSLGHSRSNRESLDPRIREDDKKEGEDDKNGDKFSILIHLKLTGQLIYQDKKNRIAGGHPIPPLNLPSPNKTTRATFEFTNGGHLYFNDMRKFGWVRIIESGKLKVESFLKNLGPDALEISLKDFTERLKAKGQSRVKKLLMDQTFVSGIGNIYSDEALWYAKVHPSRSVISLKETEIKGIYDGIKKSLTLSIEQGGSSANSFVGSGGEKGLFLSFANAYHMTGLPCKRCKTPIVRKKMDGRSAHFCPACQRLSP